MLDPPSSGTPFIILPGNSWHFMTRHILSMSFDVASPIRPEKPRKFHLCFTLCLFVLYKTLIFNILQEIVRAPFSAPNASQNCGAFLFVGWSRDRRSQRWLSAMSEGIGDFLVGSDHSLTHFSTHLTLQFGIVHHSSHEVQHPGG